MSSKQAGLHSMTRAKGPLARLLAVLVFELSIGRTASRV